MSRSSVRTEPRILIIGKGSAVVDCQACKQPFRAYPYAVKKGIAKYCSKECGYSKLRKAPKGYKNCWSCKTIKEATPDNFSTNPSKFDGLGSECVECNKAKNQVIRKSKRKEFISSRGNKCTHCGIEHEDESFFDIDHVVPLFKEGKLRKQYDYSEASNLQVLCPNCHRIKTLKDRGYRD
jgi:hypothetical protein